MRTLLIALFLATISGCATTPELTPLISKGDEDFKSGYCTLHNQKMHEKDVPLVYGMIDPPPKDFLQAERRRFPHARQWIYGGSELKPPATAAVYTCTECEQARLRWLKSHPEDKIE